MAWKDILFRNPFVFKEKGKKSAPRLIPRLPSSPDPVVRSAASATRIPTSLHPTSCVVKAEHSPAGCGLRPGVGIHRDTPNFRRLYNVMVKIEE
ncbi:hypothetical protein ElyMa_006586500 [Elysia marginata]|uniref:Uncharacterized protein n=1 Tax=Elysia marginata TaxID=1093978 RepID=A0AAV4IHK8_9GAST|nr:hypothetical protein ElyMa_006586500 [Elysia marginata]